MIVISNRGPDEWLATSAGPPLPIRCGRRPPSIGLLPTPTTWRSRVSPIALARSRSSIAGDRAPAADTHARAPRWGDPQRGLGPPRGPFGRPRSWARQGRCAPLWITHERPGEVRWLSQLSRAHHRTLLTEARLRYAISDTEKENNRTTKHPRDRVCHTMGGMLVRKGGPLRVKTDLSMAACSRTGSAKVSGR